MSWRQIQPRVWQVQWSIEYERENIQLAHYLQHLLGFSQVVIDPPRHIALIHANNLTVGTHIDRADIRQGCMGVLHQVKWMCEEQSWGMLGFTLEEVVCIDHVHVLVWNPAFLVPRRRDGLQVYRWYPLSSAWCPSPLLPRELPAQVPLDVCKATLRGWLVHALCPQTVTVEEWMEWIEDTPLFYCLQALE